LPLNGAGKIDRQIVAEQMRGHLAGAAGA